MASELQLGEVRHACPFIWDAVQPHMPVVIALLSCDIQLLQLHFTCPSLAVLAAVTTLTVFTVQHELSHARMALMQSAIGPVSTISTPPLCSCVELLSPAFEHNMVT